MSAGTQSELAPTFVFKERAVQRYFWACDRRSMHREWCWRANKVITTTVDHRDLLHGLVSRVPCNSVGSTPRGSACAGLTLSLARLSPPKDVLLVRIRPMRDQVAVALSVTPSDRTPVASAPAVLRLAAGDAAPGDDDGLFSGRHHPGDQARGGGGAAASDRHGAAAGSVTGSRCTRNFTETAGMGRLSGSLNQSLAQGCVTYNGCQNWIVLV